MVGSICGKRETRRLPVEAIRSLRARRNLYQDRFEQGIMIEVVDAMDINLSITRRGKRVHFCSMQCRDEYYYRERREQPSLMYRG